MRATREMRARITGAKAICVLFGVSVFLNFTETVLGSTVPNIPGQLLSSAALCVSVGLLFAAAAYAVYTVREKRTRGLRATERDFAWVALWRGTVRETGGIKPYEVACALLGVPACLLSQDIDASWSLGLGAVGLALIAIFLISAEHTILKRCDLMWERLQP